MKNKNDNKDRNDIHNKQISNDRNDKNIINDRNDRHIELALLWLENDHDIIDRFDSDVS